MKYSEMTQEQKEKLRFFIKEIYRDTSFVASMRASIFHTPKAVKNYAQSRKNLNKNLDDFLFWLFKVKNHKSNYFFFLDIHTESWIRSYAETLNQAFLNLNSFSVRNIYFLEGEGKREVKEGIARVENWVSRYWDTFYSELEKKFIKKKEK